VSFYQRRLLPRLIDRAMRVPALAEHRPRVPRQARGVVLELGIGPGLNLPWYTSAVSRLYGLDPSDELRTRAAADAERRPFPVTLLANGAEDIPLERHSVDTVVTTWTLCSIPRLDEALQEVRRVLRPGGQFLFLEHGRSPDPGVARLQARVTPLLLAIAGCNPGRPIAELIGAAGFRFAELETGYFDGPRFLAWHFTGRALPL
jgi:ubiquinone/menaquinone biosynthesis C-methylase UbiE